MARLFQDYEIEQVFVSSRVGDPFGEPGCEIEAGGRGITVKFTTLIVG